MTASYTPRYLCQVIDTNRIKRRRISDTPPLDPTKELVSASVLATSSTEFINDNFKGAAEVACDNVTDESVVVSIEQAAYFLKNLTSSVFGRAYLKIRIYEAGDALAVTALTHSALPLSYDETNALIRVARDAGFSVSLCEYGFKMKLSYADARAAAVYAQQSLGGTRRILAKLAEICFTPTKR